MNTMTPPPPPTKDEMRQLLADLIRDTREFNRGLSFGLELTPIQYLNFEDACRRRLPPMHGLELVHTPGGRPRKAQHPLTDTAH